MEIKAEEIDALDEIQIEEEPALAPPPGDAAQLAVAETLQPLCRATKTKLSPLEDVISSKDYILLDVDKDGQRFRAHLVALDPHNPSRPSHPDDKYYIVGGEKYREYWAGPSWAARNFMERFPERYSLQVKDHTKRDQWLLAGTDYTALILHHAWPAEKLVFNSQEAKALYTYLLLRFFRQNDRAIKAAAFKINGEVPPPPESRIVHPELPLSPYQSCAATLATGQEGYAFFMDRGTGKTATVIQRICDEANATPAGQMMRVLVVCPPQVRTNWKVEVERFATLPGKVTVVRGDKVQRMRCIALAIQTEPECRFSIAVVGYEGVTHTLEMFSAIPWDLVIADESHFFKDPGTKRWQAMMKVRDISKRRMVLTGTPIGNSILDLWTQLEFCGKGMSGYASYKGFRSNHGVFESTAQMGVEKLLATKNLAMLQERLARISFMISKADAGLQLPDKVYDVYEVKMTEAQAKVYNMVAEELVAEIENELAAPTTMSAESILTRLLRLAQITSGFATWDAICDEDGNVLAPRRVEQIAKPNPKVEATIAMLTAEDRDPLGKTVIWCCWREDIAVLSARLTEMGLVHGCYFGDTPEALREEYVTRFNNDPTFKILVCNPQTAGEGLNLVGFNTRDPEAVQTYCDHEIFFSQNWSAILRGQAEDRAHRRGTRMPVRITDLQVPGSIDEEIRRRVRAKQTTAMTITDIREILVMVLGGGNRVEVDDDE